MSPDKKTLTKKMTMGKIGNNVASLSSEWVKEIPIYFNINKPGEVKDIRNIDSLDKETI